MYQVLLIIHVLVAVAIVGLVMLQQGRGADAGAGFGGASNSVFGARGAASFLSRTTAIMATVFFVTSLSLAYLAGKKDNTKAKDIMDVPEVAAPAAKTPADVPVAPAQSDVPAAAPNTTPANTDVPESKPQVKRPAQPEKKSKK
jgi:preprotein translocase subunit SecG